MKNYESLEAVTHTQVNINRTKKEGITLIALVVTIVILIILGAVSIHIVLGDNGIINKAKSVGAIQNSEEEKTQIRF